MTILAKFSVGVSALHYSSGEVLHCGGTKPSMERKQCFAALTTLQSATPHKPPAALIYAWSPIRWTRSLEQTNAILVPRMRTLPSSQAGYLWIQAQRSLKKKPQSLGSSPETDWYCPQSPRPRETVYLWQYVSCLCQHNYETRWRWDHSVSLA